MSNKRKQGELESAIMGCLWDRPDGLSSQQILALLGDDELAITTVLTVLSRLSDKKMVQKQQGDGRKLLFVAATSREAHTANLLLEAMEQTNNPAMVFSHFASGLSQSQIAKLRQALDQ